MIEISPALPVTDPHSDQPVSRNNNNDLNKKTN